MGAYFNPYKFFINMHTEFPAVFTYSTECYVTTRTVLLDQVTICAMGRILVLPDVEIHTL
jgi:hypothetical protein